MNDRKEWLRVVGGGCVLNTALTGLLVGLFLAIAASSLDTLALPFLIGASASFGASLYLLRQSDSPLPVMIKVILAGVGVLLGSIAAVLGIALFLLMQGV